jgi:hypothetical protein
MRASSGQSRDRTRPREGDEAVVYVYVYVNGDGDEGPQNHAAVPTAWHSLGACHTRSSDVMRHI